MSSTRDEIPAPIKREIRQRCGFGCVICGNPIIDYDHIYDYAIVQRHVADEMTLLCPEHHREKTAGRLPLSMVLAANDNPYNLKNGETTPKFLYYSGNNAVVTLGTVDFIPNGNAAFKQLAPIVMFNNPLILLNIENEQLSLNICLYNQLNQRILLIEDNELKVNLGVWDIQFVGTRLTIHERSYHIFIEINFLTPNIVHFERGNIYYKGVYFKIHPTRGLSYIDKTGENIMTLSDFQLCSKVGIAIGGDKYIGNSILYVPLDS